MDIFRMITRIMRSGIILTLFAIQPPIIQAEEALEDLTYIAVPPCRIVDTREAIGSISARTSREFVVYGDALTIQSQGGDSACESPRGEPAAVHVNVTVIPIDNGGNVRAYPAGEPLPNASTVNYQPGTNIANAAIVKTAHSTLNDTDIEVYASSRVHIVLDVLGYFYKPQKWVIRDSNDKLIGDVIEFDVASAASAIYVFTDTEGIEHGVMAYVTTSEALFFGPLMYWNNSNCSGDPTHIKKGSFQSPIAPIFSETYFAGQRFPQPNQGVFDLIAVDGTEQYIQLYSDTGVGCNQDSEPDWYLPIAVQVQDLAGQFVPPFTARLE